MLLLDEIFQRINLVKLREYLLYGSSQEDYSAESYKERLDKSYDDYIKTVKLYDSAGDDSELYTAMTEILTEHQHVYMELGVQAGFLLSQTIHTNTIDLFSTSLYKQMYFFLFNSITDILELSNTNTNLISEEMKRRLQDIQQNAEDMYVTKS